MKISTSLDGAGFGKELPAGIVVPEIAFGTTVSLPLQHSRMRRMSEETRPRQHRLVQLVGGSRDE